jgi:Asp-tRNA(Asn)/Glu-tRNA(Gln) amidotransferase A subunit family amidase
MRLFPDEAETIAGAARSLRRGDVTCRALVEQCLARIDEWEADVHAWVSVDREGARQLADGLDAELRAGRLRGPLHGIPVGIKDIVDIAGLPTGAGSRRMAETIAQTDATVVQRLRAAGAILLGKTVTTQFACFDPPPTRNPWNLARTPGGSSSGSAAAVATGMCLGAIGSQTGGSITRPATYCGVCGCKATYGRVSLAGIMPLAPSLDHPGPIARCVTDLAILFEAIAGPDPRDPRSLGVALEAIDALKLDAADVPPPTLICLGGFFETRSEPAVSAAFQAAVSRMASAGAKIQKAELPSSFEYVHRRHRAIFAHEFAQWHEQRFRQYRDDYLPGAASLVEEGLAVSDREYSDAKRHQDETRQEALEVLGETDAAICPAALDPAPDVSNTGDPAFNSPWSYTGLPTVSLPIALTDEHLPVGLQFVGKVLAERTLFETSLWCERVLRATAR